MAYKSREQALQYGKEYRSMCKRLKVCVYCLCQDAYTLAGRSACFDCAEKYAKRRKEKYSAIDRSAYRKELRQRHIANHECTVCGKKLPQEYKYKTCKGCMAYNKLRQRTSETFSRGKYGLCWTCNKQPAIQGKGLCKDCYDRQLSILRKIPINKNHKWRNLNYGNPSNKKQKES
jgi:hypothetical protein